MAWSHAVTYVSKSLRMALPVGMLTDRWCVSICTNPGVMCVVVCQHCDEAGGHPRGLLLGGGGQPGHERGQQHLRTGGWVARRSRGREAGSGGATTASVSHAVKSTALAKPLSQHHVEGGAEVA